MKTILSTIALSLFIQVTGAALVSAQGGPKYHVTLRVKKTTETARVVTYKVRLDNPSPYHILQTTVSVVLGLKNKDGMQPAFFESAWFQSISAGGRAYTTIRIPKYTNSKPRLAKKGDWRRLKLSHFYLKSIYITTDKYLQLNARRWFTAKAWRPDNEF